MNILFVSISSFPHISEHSISLDLIHEFQKAAHNVYVVCAKEKRENGETSLSIEEGCKVLRVKVGNNKCAGIIEKGITNIMLPSKYISAIKKHYANVKFDLVLYPTPPVTQVKTVKYIKKRDNAKTYLLLKDIFPQNAVDIGMLKKRGVKGPIYKYFKHKEKNLYKISDKIGCMSKANCDYILKHNPEISADKVEVCHNSIEPRDMRLSVEEKAEVRKQYNLPDNKKIFIYGGNLGRPQDVPFIIKCLKECADLESVHFVVAGKGTDRKYLEEYVNNEKPSHITLFEQLPKEEYDKMAASCDAGLIFLDHRFTIPNFPSRLLSYMQAGLPVIAATDINTDLGKTTVDGKFGFWCESAKTDDFKALIQKSLNSDLKQMGQNGYEYMLENFAVDKSYQTIIAHYTE